MKPTPRSRQSPGPGRARFATTRWSLVFAAGQSGSAESRRAVESLCEAYWYPLYAYIRRRGYGAEDAEDRTQEFFARLLEKRYLETADRERGRFRTFLLTAFRRFLAKEEERAGALKRGGGRRVLSLDFSSAEDRYRAEPAHEWTPERIYERRWALTVLDQVLARLREEYERTKKRDLFDGLKAFLSRERGGPSYREAAGALGTTEGAVKVAVHRLRRRYRDLLRDEVSQTLADPEDSGDELRHLLAALSAGGRRPRNAGESL